MNSFKSSSLLFLNSLFFVTLFSFSSCDAQPTISNESPEEGGIEWVSFEKAVALSQNAPKKIFIDVYTNWCGWCKKMDKSTFMEKEVIEYINTNYYAVKLDAETKDTIKYKDKEFKYLAEYKANELAISLLGGKMGYPSYVLLDENFSMMTPPVQSYLTKENLMPILTYYGDNIFKEKTWEEYANPKTN